MDALKLVIFDVDGTLIDSQHAIVAAMEDTARALDLPPPTRDAILRVVGLSLPVAMARLFPGASETMQDTAVARYKDTYAAHRSADGGLPVFFRGMKEVLLALHAKPEVLLATATGMSRRGMRAIVEGHGLTGVFASLQTADDHPSKPHPAMVRAALRETGVARENAVIVGDTTYDIEAGRAAGVLALGVAWGYHGGDELRRAGALDVVETPAQLIGAIDAAWSET